MSSLLYKINPTTKTPIHAVFFCAIFSLLLGLISFAGPVAISAVFTMSVVCQYLVFITPIVARFVGGSTFVPGPFYLGKLVRHFFPNMILPLLIFSYVELANCCYRSDLYVIHDCHISIPKPNSPLFS